jgi:hypothetical protein
MGPPRSAPPAGALRACRRPRGGAVRLDLQGERHLPPAHGRPIPHHHRQDRAVPPELAQGVPRRPNFNLAAIDVWTGTELWEEDLGGLGGSAHSAPTVAHGVVYIGVGGESNTIFAVNASTGATIWSYNTGSSAIGGSAVVGGGRVYFSALTVDVARHLEEPPEGFKRQLTCGNGRTSRSEGQCTWLYTIRTQTRW